MSPRVSAAPLLSFRLALLALGVAPALEAQGRTACAPDNGGLTLPSGFCGAVVADGLGEVRQLAVGPDGVLYAAVSAPNAAVVALRDTNGDGRADERAAFGRGGGNDVEVRNGWLYLAQPERILRWRLPERGLAPTGAPETVIDGLPAEGHRQKSIAFGKGGEMYVSIGSATNSCQREDRRRRSPGQDPCRELERHAGIWRFDADRAGQRFADGRRFATGLRNPAALTVDPGSGGVYAAVHGRDQLGDNWGFSDQANAENPAEELVAAREGDDFGWPYCYYSTDARAKVLAPEYGGDGRKVGRCAGAKAPLVAYPAHWAPLALGFYTSDAFGPEYRGGLFLAFHGSWNRAPLPQAGYRVVFQPLAGDRPSGEYRTFATGATPTSLRASGLAVGADGALYISSDRDGKIWKVVRQPR